jgi:hypothetical protein
VLRPRVRGAVGERFFPLCCMVVGTALGGALLGLVAAVALLVLAPVDGARIGVIVALTALALIGTGWPRVGRWLPERACQVSNSPMLSGSLRRAGFRWGIRLGLGLCTFLVTPAFYALPAVAIGQHHPWEAVLVCAVYGGTRGTTIAAFTVMQASRDRKGLPEAEPALKDYLRFPLVAAILIAGLLAIV